MHHELKNRYMYLNCALDELGIFRVMVCNSTNIQ